MKTILFTFFAVLFISSQCYSNNLQVSTGTLTGQNTTYGYTNVQFNLSWDNSWRDANNWDAVWIFIKYKRSVDTAWSHALLSDVASEHTVPAGFTVAPTLDAVGVYIYRSAAGNGSVNLNDVQLRWNYYYNGVGNNDLVEVKVYGIEMVFVPEGSFYVGDGTAANVAGQFSAGNTTNPFLINSESGLTLGGTSTLHLGNRNGDGMANPDDFNDVTEKTLNSSFPKGYSQFFCMKYEISQGQYTDFLNTLTRYQQNQRTQVDVSTDVITDTYVMTDYPTLYYRNVIRCPSSGNGITEPIVFYCDLPRPDRACNYLSWGDGLAYMDWSGLRPMTELEFEKACRGPLVPVADEYAWGTNTICPDVSLTISGTENGTEYITTGVSLGGCCYGNHTHTGGDGGEGPFRCGIFAMSNTTRTEAGATYYGIMEMSGNVIERTIAVGNSNGRDFTGNNGDGMIDTDGNANVIYWPTHTGSNYRGGNYQLSYLISRLSDRYFGNVPAPGRASFFGFRGVRTATNISDKSKRNINTRNE